MSTLDEIKQRKLQVLQEHQQTQQQIAQLESSVKQYFTTEALQRYGNIKAAHQETALKLIVMLAQALKAGQLKQKIDDRTLKKLLTQLAQKRDIKIVRK
jgi:DNA-binding TFAR19-related protein (PDSD5 family)